MRKMMVFAIPFPAFRYVEPPNEKNQPRIKRMSAVFEDNRKFVRATMLLAGVLVQAMAACAEVGSYAVKDSGRTSRGIHGWLDNERVLFQSEQSTAPKLQGNSSGKGQYIWNVSTGQVTKDTTLEGASTICLRGDSLTFIRKSATDDKKWLVVVRTKAGETESPLINTQWFNRFTCRYYDQKPEWIIPNHQTLPLLDGHGYLDWSPTIGPDSFRNKPLKFRINFASEWMDLPIGTREVWHNLVKYAPFKNSYLLYPITYIDRDTGKEEPIGPWPQGKPVPVWWLNPDGIVTTETVPYVRFMRGGSRSYFPTQVGIFITTHKADDVGQPGDAGGYLARNGQVTKVITGLLDSVSISPDGCRVAFIHDPYDTVYGNDRLDRITVKSINVCRGNRHDR
jgi:hypothetical protein